jgi:hypothetical protein
MTKPGSDADGIAKTEADHFMRCKNPLSVALTPRDFGDVAVRGHSEGIQLSVKRGAPMMLAPG